MAEMKLQELKVKTPPELLAFAEEHEVENASAMRKQELLFAILKKLAEKDLARGSLKCCRTGLVSCDHRKPITCQALTTSMFRRHRSANSPCARGTRSRV
jgi:hypothetical protein